MSFWLLWQENTYLYVELALDPKDYSVYRWYVFEKLCVLNCLLSMLVCLPFLLRTFHSCCCMVVVLFSCRSRV